MSRICFLCALIGISLTAFLTTLDFAIVNAALPVIQNALNMSFKELQWIMNIYAILVAMILVAAGRIGDIVGHRKVLSIGSIIFLVASILCGASTSGLMLILGRAFQGFGSAIIIPCSLALVSSTTDEKHRGKAIGIWSSISGVGLALGPVIGSLLVTWLGWQSIFYINVPFTILALAMFLPFVKETNKKQESLDIIGFITLGFAIASFTFLLVDGEAMNWTPWFVVSNLAVFVLAIFFFIRHEKRANFPMVQLSLFKHPGFLMGMTGNFTMVFFAYVCFFLLPLFFAKELHFHTAAVGLSLLPITLLMTMMSPVVGVWIDRASFKQPLSVGLMFLIASAIMQFCFYWIQSLAFIVVALALMGIAWGCIFGSSAIAAINALPDSEAGQATGALWTIQNLGATIGITLITLLYNVLSHNGFMYSFSASMLILFCLSAAALLFVLYLFTKFTSKTVSV